jgi:hypothetical protein
VFEGEGVTFVVGGPAEDTGDPNACNTSKNRKLKECRA